MTKLDRSKRICFLVFLVLILGAASCSQKSPPASEPTAKPSAAVPEKTSAAVREQIAKGCPLILTTGGTGVALRDVTPEAVREIAVRELRGFGEVMRIESMKITKNAILSRNLAVVVEKALVICLPGKPSGAVECLGFVVGAVPHCVEVLQEVPTSC